MSGYNPLRLTCIRKYYLCCLMFCGVLCCGPGRGGFRRRSTHKLLPLVFKQHVPNVPENSLAASGPSDGRIRRGDERFKMLVPNYNTDVVWADRTGTGSDRIMTRRLKERLDMLAISVQNQWPGVRLRVTNAFDEEGHHAEGSLHYSARAVDVTTSDRDTSKYGLLARMAVNSGFDFVYYESRLQIHCSVKKEQPTSRSYMGCFHGDSIVLTTKGRKKMKYLEVGEEIASDFEDGVSLKFSKVITFLHRDAQMKTMFIKLEIENGNVLLLTKSHIIFRYETRAANQKMYENLKFPTFTNILFNNYEATHAGNILIGDFVYIGSSNGNASISKVCNITFVELNGVFAPLTESGTIFVEDIYVSCYALVTNHNLAHAAFFPLRFIDRIYSFRIESIFQSLYEYIFVFLDKGTRFDVENKHNDRKSYIHGYARFLWSVCEKFTTYCE